MANPELELISNIIKTGDMTTVRKKGITPEFFQTEEAGLAFKWIWDQFHDPRYRGEVPDKDRLLRKFPDFPWYSSRNSVAALLSDLTTENLRGDIQHIIGEVNGLIDEGQDPELVMRAFMPKLRELGSRMDDSSGMFMRDSFNPLKQDYLTTKDGGGITGIPFPWSPLNVATGGMHPEDFIVLYGRPKNMKTWAALAIAAHAYLNHRRVYIFSKEMRVLTMARRLASLIAELDYAKIKQATLSDEDEHTYFAVLEALGDFEEDTIEGGSKSMNLYFDSDKGRRQATTPDDLIMRAEKFNPDLIVVDGLYLMRDGRSKSRSADWKNVAHISQDLKGGAQYLECPLLGTTQANRSGAKGPTDDGTDLSYADSLFQDADLAMRVFKGPNPDRKYKYAIALTFPGLREADLRPFLINAAPGGDFSVCRQTVDMQAFLDGKKALDREETEAQGGNGAGKTKPKSKRPSGFRAT